MELRVFAVGDVCGGSGLIPGGGRCRHCHGSGYRGRTGIFELLEIDDAMRDAIHRSASSSELEEIACRHGMVTLAEDGMKKVAARVTTASEVLRSAGNTSEGADHGRE